MVDYIEQQDYIVALQQEQAQADAARYEQLGLSIQSLADAVDRLAAAITDQANVRITDE